MGNINISNRYAEALIELSEERKILDKVTEDMRMIQLTLHDSRELRNILASPIIKDSKKNEIINAVFGDKITKDTINFLAFIIDKRRIDILFDIVKRFNDLRDNALGIANAEIVTASSIDESEKNLITDKLEQFTKFKLRTNYKVDENILGGFKVKISDQVIDASLKNQLDKLKKTLLKEQIFNN